MPGISYFSESANGGEVNASRKTAIPKPPSERRSCKTGGATRAREAQSGLSIHDVAGELESSEMRTLLRRSAADRIIVELSGSGTLPLASTLKECVPEEFSVKRATSVEGTIVCCGLRDFVVCRSRGPGNRIASIYAYAGSKTASGQRAHPGGLTAAHRTLPFGSWSKSSIAAMASRSRCGSTIADHSFRDASSTLPGSGAGAGLPAGSRR